MLANFFHQRARRTALCAASVALACGLTIPGVAQDGPPPGGPPQNATQQQPAGNTQIVAKLDDAIGSLAKDIMKYMEADQAAGKTVVLETLRGPNQTVSGRVAQMLKTQFEGAEYKVVSGGAYTITGRFMSGDRDGTSVARFSVQLLNRSGVQMQEFQREITDLGDGINLLGPTFDVSTQNALPPQELKEKVTEAIEQPNVFTANSVIKATPESPYGIELLAWDGTQYVPVPVEKIDGIARCDIQTNQEFAIRIHNTTNEFVGARVTLDGINMYAFSKNDFYRGYGRMAIFPKQAPLIKGWHEDGDLSFSFKVTDYGQSAASSLGVIEGLGTITVTFFKCYEGKGPGDVVPSGQVAVGKGTPRDMKYTNVRVDIPENEIVGAISVQYSRPRPPVDLPDGE